MKFAGLSLPKAKLGIINATKCYHEINKFRNKNIRTLFASTSVKGDELEPTYYVDNLLFPNSVNTAPLGTIEDYIKEGKKVEANIASVKECDAFFELLEKNNINMDDIYNTLLKDGLDSFRVSFEDMLSKLTKQ